MLSLILAGAVAVCGVMLLLWLIHLPLHNAAIVDVGWAGGLALLGVLYAILGTGWAPRRTMFAAMALLWGLRLALYLLFTRVIGQPEEGRYVQLRREWRGHVALKFLAFFQFQAVLCLVLAIYFQEYLRIRDHWRVSDVHYQKTAEDWFQRFDRHRKEVLGIFSSVYGRDEALRWLVRWRVFFMACAELFGYAGGKEWMVSHYLFQNRASQGAGGRI
jgi:hypothetical protein